MRILNDINDIADRYQEVTPNQAALVLNLLKRVECPYRLAELIISMHPLISDHWSIEDCDLLLAKLD